MPKRAPKRNDYQAARLRAGLTPGQALRLARELQEMSQADLALASHVSQPTISGIEKGRLTLGAERAEKLARVLRVHPAVLLFPNWEQGADAPARGRRSAAS